MSGEVARIGQIMLDAFWPLMKAGLMTTIPLTIVSFILGLILAFIVALCRLSTAKPLQLIARFYVWAIRGIPLLVLLFVVFYGLPKVGIMFGPFTSATIGLTMNQGAYNSEIIRSAITSINKGQWEATKALGMTRGQTLANVIVPQAALIAVPPLGNTFIGLTKDTSLAAILTVREVFMIGQQTVAQTFEPLWIYIEVGVVFLIFSSVLGAIQSYMEKKLGKHLEAQKSNR